MSKMVNSKSNISNENSPSTGQCIPQETMINNVRLAAAYVPYQKLCTLFSPIEALKAGTAFPELFSPYDKKNENSKRNVDEY